MTVLYQFVRLLATAFNLAILVRILLTWIPVDRDNRVIAFIHEITEPILGPLRRVVPPIGGFDISPMLAMMLIELARIVLLTAIASVA